MPIAIIKDTKAKFNTGDKCRFNGRVPDYISQDLRRRTRTITQAFYDSDNQCCYYQLGGRGKGELGYWFRSYMLLSVDGNRHNIGRPRQKRQYKHKVARKVLIANCSQNLGGVSIN